MNELWPVFLGAILWENVAFSRLLGLEPVVFEGRHAHRHLFFAGMMLTLILILGILIVWPVEHYLLVPHNRIYLRNMVAVLVLLALTFAVSGIVHRIEYDPGWGYYLPDLFMNSLLLGLVVINLQNEQVLRVSVSGALGAGLGLTGLLLVMQGIKDRLQPVQVPSFLRGIPLNLIILGILALALSGFEGI